MAQAIRSFPNGSTGGPDGLRPQHLKDMTGPSSGSALAQCSDIFHQPDHSRTPETVRPLFFGANLVALEKKVGGVRLIAVGCTLRRLAAKAAASRVRSAMNALLAPRQLGYRTPQGAEAAVHTARIYLDNLPADRMILKLVFSNFFNCLH